MSAPSVLVITEEPSPAERQEVARAKSLAELPPPVTRPLLVLPSSRRLAYLDCISLRLYLTVMGAPSVPSAFCGLYCHSISLMFRLTESTGRLLAWASPLTWNEDTSRPL